MALRGENRMNWISVCQVDEVEEYMPKAVDVNDVKIGIFQLNDQYFAIENVCPHAYALLTEGFVEDGTVECPLHEAIFDIQTGNLESGPGCRNLCTYPIKVEDGAVFVSLEK